jgi:hypothetical protein
MALDDSERAHARRWVEHARDPSVESTPRAVDAAEGGEIELERRLGFLGINYLREANQAWVRRLTKVPGHVRQLGHALHDRIDFEELPSRIEIRQQWADGEGQQDDLPAKEVGELRLKAGLEQLSPHQWHDIVASIIDIEDEDSDNDDKQPPRSDTQKTSKTGDFTSRGAPNYSRKPPQKRRNEVTRGPVRQDP